MVEEDRDYSKENRQRMLTPLNPINPRYDARRAANQDAYNSCENSRLVFN